MSTDACQFFHECEGCAVLLRPATGDCCVFCSYGTKPCPPKQVIGGDGGCCAGESQALCRLPKPGRIAAVASSGNSVA